MARKQVLLIASGPSHGAVGALELAVGMKGQGQQVDVCLIEDAVLCALEGDGAPAGAAMLCGSYVTDAPASVPRAPHRSASTLASGVQCA